jgi:hypothetical protein
VSAGRKFSIECGFGEVGEERLNQINPFFALKGRGFSRAVNRHPFARL